MSSSEGQSLFEQGDRLAAEGDLEAAEEAYRRADAAGHGAAATKLGLLLERRGHQGQALEAYTRADERGDGAGAFRRGLVLSAAGDWESAEAAWARANDRGRELPGLDLAAVLAASEPATGSGPPRVAAASPAFANPVLIGALTSLALLLAVFLAYSANQGLPFVPTRELRVDIADGSDVVVGNDVREGGFRIGLVGDMKPVRLPDGQVGAQLVLKLDQADGSVPVDSTAAILPRSVLGLKYVELQKGISPHLIPDGGILPLTHTSVPVQLDDVFKTFEPRTRTAIQQALVGAGDTLASRGSSLNDTIASLPGLLGHLRPVASYLTDPRTELTRFFDDLNLFVGAVAPVAGVNARLFGEAATTFAAISRDPNAYEQTIAHSPGALATGTDSLRTQQPLLADLTTFGHNLTPAASELRTALPDVNLALEAGTRTLIRTPPLNRDLQGVLDALKQLALAPGTNIAVNALGDTTTTLDPMIRYLGPFQTVCDYWNYWWTNLSEHISQPTGVGFAQRALLSLAAPGPNSIGQVGAEAPANGESGSDAFPLSLLGGAQFLHNPSYGAAIDNQGNADCEVGQRGYPKRLNSGDPLKRNLDTDPHTPGDQGPTYHGRARVPAGETFSRAPSTGPELSPNPANP